ncbi:hypothetical protein GCM10023321_50680 [Pseudonocardia eucalypti]|uniref:Uncharacterized protein n=1 Tax=Pseudonocardia eucalypti TaxID=648755 RepID=A0ABP9QKS3_9PSEU
MQPLRAWQKVSTPRESAVLDRLHSPTPQVVLAVVAPALVSVPQPLVGSQNAFAVRSPALTVLEQPETPTRQKLWSRFTWPVVGSIAAAEHSANTPVLEQAAPAPS